MINIRPDEISNIIRQQIESYDQEVQIDNVGTVLQIGDGIARVYGLEQVMAGELLEFEDKTIGIALNLENDNVGAVLMGQGIDILEGSSVRSTGKIAFEENSEESANAVSKKSKKGNERRCGVIFGISKSGDKRTNKD